MENQAKTDSNESSDTLPTERSQGAPEHDQATPAAGSESATNKQDQPVEIGGPSGLEPTRYGDWERKGRCVDF